MNCPSANVLHGSTCSNHSKIMPFSNNLEICDEMLELYGGKKKERPLKTKENINIEKSEPSPNNSSSTSSPSVTNSPPFKKKVIVN